MEEEILNSRGNPTVEVEVTSADRDNGKEDYGPDNTVPSGASTGRFEANVKPRDGQERYFGFKISAAFVDHMNTKIRKELLENECAGTG